MAEELNNPAGSQQAPPTNESYSLKVDGKDFAFPTRLSTADGTEIETKWLFEKVIGQSRKQEKAAVREELSRLQQSNHDLESALEELKTQGMPEAERQTHAANKRAEQAEKALQALQGQIERQSLESEIFKALTPHSANLHAPDEVAALMKQHAVFEDVGGERKAVINWKEKRLTPADFMLDFMQDETKAHHRKNTLNSGAGSTAGGSTAGGSTAEGVYRRSEMKNPETRAAIAAFFKKTGREPTFID